MLWVLAILIGLAIVFSIVGIIIESQAKEKKKYFDKYLYMIGNPINPDFPDEYVTQEVFNRAKQVVSVLRGMDDFRFNMVPDGKDVIIESSCTRMILCVSEQSLDGFIKQPGYRLEEGKSENVINIRLTFSVNELWSTKLWNVVRASLHDRIPQPRS